MLCHWCGGVFGKDCFNTQECGEITRQMAAQFQQQGDVHGEIAHLRASLEATREMVRRAVRGLKHCGPFRRLHAEDPHPMDCTLAGRVSQVFCTGMTRATELCVDAGEDPHFSEPQPTIGGVAFTPENCVKRKHSGAYIGYAKNGLGVWSGGRPNELLCQRAIDKAQNATDEFRRMLWQDAAIALSGASQPERVEAPDPTCPHCGLVHEMMDMPDYFTIDCDCGWRFSVATRVVLVSSPMAHRN